VIKHLGALAQIQRSTIAAGACRTLDSLPFFHSVLFRRTPCLYTALDV
jgi:hypothetical protein